METFMEATLGGISSYQRILKGCSSALNKLHFLDA